MKQTQDDRVLAWLLCGLPITSKDAIFRLGVTRLAAIIERLEKQKGWKGFIQHEDIKVLNRFGEVTRCTKYYL